MCVPLRVSSDTPFVKTQIQQFPPTTATTTATAAAIINMPLNIPPGATCTLTAIDTSCALTVTAKELVEPVISGHEYLNFPTISFLITQPSSNRKILFDLGCRKDFWNLPPPIADVIDRLVPGIRVDSSLPEVLLAHNKCAQQDDDGQEGDATISEEEKKKKKGLVNDLSEIEAAVISHHHYDHMGQPGLFPRSTDLVVGPGFREAFLPGWPANPASPAHEADFEGRRVRQLSFDDDEEDGEEYIDVAGYKALDYFGDGSFYILRTTGHTVEHMSALARTGPESFCFLGGDICHFCGVLRPTPEVTMPSSLTAGQIGGAGVEEGKSYPASLFAGCHPSGAEAVQKHAPFQSICSGADSWYTDPLQARESIERLKKLDADERVLVLIAHDPAVWETVPLYSNGTMEGWETKGYKEKIRWGFLRDLPVFGLSRQPRLVDGTFMDGRRVKTLEGEKVEDA